MIAIRVEKFKNIVLFTRIKLICLFFKYHLVCEKKFYCILYDVYIIVFNLFQNEL